ncbi:MAG: HAD family phosphatase [Nitrospinaceae bacterium]|nr:HAD family phosphatase [Nitrospina sp.]MBT5376535.1 HAD family phosphatase [Nitrospinaceae bacterium]MBT5867809.1 HAD family phosphatase [Nitrospinaceae bacterium]MBT6345755.1 HAD family phosphatase [Nitrospina sp.]
MNMTDPTVLKKKLHSLLTNCKAAVLDFDGLLADSEPFHYRAYNEVFERYGHTLDKDEYWVEWTSKGKGIAGEIERHNLNLDVDPLDLRKQKFEVYSRFCQSGEIKLFPLAQSMAEALSANHKLAIASGSWVKDIRSILGNATALDLFPVILGKESAAREKPHPDIFLNAAEQLGCPPHECFVLEDALKGLQAAKEAGMPCIILRNPLNQNIDFAGAELIFESLEGFVAALQP